MPLKEEFQSAYQESIQREQSGDLEGAIEQVRTALAVTHDASHVISTLEHHLRLPLLLLRAGRVEEARSAFRALLEDGYPGQYLRPDIQWRERGIIYNRMRAAFEVVERPNEAVIYGALSFIADSYGRFLDMYRPDYEDDVHRMRSPQTQAAMAGVILTEESKGITQSQLAAVLGGAIERFEDALIDEIVGDVEQVLRQRLQD